MPLSFPDPTIAARSRSGAGLGDLADQYQQNKVKNEVLRARGVLAGQEDADNRSYLQKAMDKAKGVEYQPMDQERAMGVLAQYDPDTYSQVVKQQEAQQKQAQELQTKVGPFVHKGVQRLLAVPEEERAAVALPMLGELKKMGVDVSGFDANADGVFSDDELKPLLEATSIYTEADGDFTLSPGSGRYDKSGKLIAERSTASDGKITYKEVKEGNDYVTYQVNPDGRLGKEVARGPRSSENTKFTYKEVKEGNEFVTYRLKPDGSIDQEVARGPRSTETAKPFSLSPGQIRFDADGNEIVRAPGKPTERQQKINDATQRLIKIGYHPEDAAERAGKVIDKTLKIEQLESGQVREINLETGDVKEVKVQGGKERVGLLPGKKTLFQQAELATGPISGAKEFWSGTVGAIPGVPISEETIRARQDLRTETQQLIRSLAINQKFPIGEQERIIEEVQTLPKFFDSPEALRQRMISVDGSLRQRLEQAQRDADDPSLPQETREAQSANASAIRNYLDILGAPEPIPTSVEEIQQAPVDQLKETMKYMTDDDLRQLYRTDPQLIEALERRITGG